MKNNARKLVLLSAIAAGLAGMVGTASAQQFGIGATVQNAITLTEVTPLDLGTVFATTTALGLSAATGSAKMTLSDTGTVTVTAPPTGVGEAAPILSLGGATAGAYSAPGLPSNATVVVSFLTADDTAFTPTTAALADCTYDTPAAALTAGEIVLQSTVGGGDPTIGFFCVNAFTTNRANLLTTGYSLGFGVTDLTFNLGATIIGQEPATAITRTFESGAYAGSFGMEVSFP